MYNTRKIRTPTENNAIFIYKQAKKKFYLH